jgi:hypothetical protein
MEANERLSDLRALRQAVASQRDAQVRLVNSVGYRKRRLKNCIHRIRSLRVALMRSIKELLEIRGATNGEIDKTVLAYDGRLRELDQAILHQEQRVRIERVRKLMAQMNDLGAELPPEMLAEAQAQMIDIDEDLILS